MQHLFLLFVDDGMSRTSNIAPGVFQGGSVTVLVSVIGMSTLLSH